MVLGLHAAHCFCAASWSADRGRLDAPGTHGPCGSLSPVGSILGPSRASG